MALRQITALGSNWSSAPIYHRQTRNFRLHGGMIKATALSSVRSAYSFSKETFISHFRFSSFSLLSNVYPSPCGSNKNGNHDAVYQRSLHCINNHVTVAIINIVHTRSSTAECDCFSIFYIDGAVWRNLPIKK